MSLNLGAPPPAAVRPIQGHSDVLERMMGIEPTLSAWEAGVLPMNYIRIFYDDTTKRGKFQEQIGDFLRLLFRPRRPMLFSAGSGREGAPRAGARGRPG